MISTLLPLSRKLFVIDSETTGVDPQKDRIVEIAFQCFEPEVGLTKEWRSLINPGIPIPAEATAVHGITDGKVQSCRGCRMAQADHPYTDNDQVCETFLPVPTFAQLAPSLAKGFTECDWAGQNVRFDLQILFAEFARAGIAWNYVGAKILDAHQLERLAVPRSLSHLHQKYTGFPHDGAHGALSDVRAAVTVIVKQLETYDTLPRDLGQLHEMQWPDEWLDTGGKFRLVDGVPTCCFGKKHRGVALKDIPLDYLDWIIRSDFPADVKALASGAKLNRGA